MYNVHDWAEVRRLYHRKGRTKAEIARRLGMSRTTVIRLLELTDAPHYRRAPQSSKLDPFKEAIDAMLAEDPEAPATVVLRELRRRGYAGGITILKEHLARERPAFLRARSTRGRATFPES